MASGYHFSTVVAVGSIVAAVVVVAYFTNRFAPGKRRHMRNTALAALFYVMASVAAWALALLGAPGPALVAREVAEFCGLLTAINLGVLLVFDLGLSAIGVSFGPFLSGLMLILGYLAAVVITLRHLGVELSSILATSALLSTITAFSLQGTLANIVGGLALQLDDSVRVGDWVQLESGKQGKVREIRWRYTVIETRDWDTMIVPNATILSSSLMILGKREGQPLQHRMWVYFNVDFRYSPADVVEAVNVALQAAPIEGVAVDPKPHAICYDFARDGRDSFAYYAVRYWLTDLSRDDPTSSKVRERIFTALKRAGIPLAMPAAHLWIEQDSENRTRRQQAEADRRQVALDGVEFLRALKAEERAYVAGRLRYALFAPGETITKQGAVAHWLYIIISGVAEVRIAIEGDEQGGRQDPGARLRRRDGPDDRRAPHGHRRRAHRGRVLPPRQGGVQQDPGGPPRDRPRDLRRARQPQGRAPGHPRRPRRRLPARRPRGRAPAAGGDNPALLRARRRVAGAADGELRGRRPGGRRHAARSPRPGRGWSERHSGRGRPERRGAILRAVEEARRWRAAGRVASWEGEVERGEEPALPVAACDRGPGCRERRRAR